MTQASPAARVLFICRGNLCRSPMAMALFRHLLEGRPGCRAVADSAGYHDWAPFPREAHPFARRAVARLTGTDSLADHTAKAWTPELVEWATCIVVAEEWMRADFPAEKAVTLRWLAGQTGDVTDPYGHDLRTHYECGREILRLLEAGLHTLLRESADGG